MPVCNQRREKGTYNNTPDNTGVVEGLGVGADQSLRLILFADLVDVADNKVIGGNLYQRQPDHSESLSGKHAAGRNLHVVTNLHVRDIGKAVGASHVTPGLEQHHGNGTSGKPG